MKHVFRAMIGTVFGAFAALCIFPIVASSFQEGAQTLSLSFWLAFVAVATLARSFKAAFALMLAMTGISVISLASMSMLEDGFLSQSAISYMVSGLQIPLAAAYLLASIMHLAESDTGMVVGGMMLVLGVLLLFSGSHRSEALSDSFGDEEVVRRL